jgi:hypothetical protein
MKKNVADTLHVNYLVYGGVMMIAKPSMLKILSKANINYNIKLRYRKTSTNAPYILYLDLIHNGKRQTKTLGISFVGDKIR